MTVIVQQSTDSNGNPQPMVYDSDTGKIIVDSNGYVINGGKRLVNVPTKADYVSTPKTTTAGIQEAWNYALSTILSYSDTSALYYIPEIKYRGGKYDIYSTVKINPPIITKNGNTYTIGNLIMKGQGSMSPYFINHVTSDYMIKLEATSSNVINTNIQVDNLQFQNASGVTGYGHLSIVTPSGKNVFQSLNLDVNGGTSQAPIIVDGCNGIVLLNYELYNNESSTSPGSIFQTNGVFSAFGCLFNGDTIWAQDIISINGSKIDWTGASDYGIIVQYSSSVFSSAAVSQVSITTSDLAFPIGVGINIGKILINGCMLAAAGTPAAMFIGLSTGLTIESVIFKHNSVYEYFNGLALPALSSNLTINEFRYDNIVGNTTLYKEILPVPTISANPPASGTVYQNTNPYNIRLKIPITYNPSTSAAATLATGISSTSTVSTSTKVSIPSGLTGADGQILTYDMVVPTGWYYELVVTNATIGTVEIEAA